MRHLSRSFICGMATVALVIGSTNAQQATAEPPAPAAEAGITGKVVETMNAGQYTYVQVDDGSKKVWAAAPQFAVAVGDKVVVPAGIPMRDFESKTLQRTFDLVYFVQEIQMVGGKAADGKPAAAHGPADQGATDHGAAGHPGADHGVPGHGAPAATNVDLSNIKKAEGGQTVNELFVKKGALVGKDVVVRGRVVKYTANVMGKNWVHVQDGTGTAGTNDLTVTTAATAAVGDTVVVRGKLSADKDFGFGYKYDILIEDGTVAAE